MGLHFFNPVQLMKLVEIVRIPETEQAVFEAAQGTYVQAGDRPRPDQSKGRKEGMVSAAASHTIPHSPRVLPSLSLHRPAASGYVKKIGKVGVDCKDTPGFIVNRLLVPALAQAMLLHERGEASVADIDVSMQLGAGHPMGPLTLADYVSEWSCCGLGGARGETNDDIPSSRSAHPSLRQPTNQVGLDTCLFILDGWVKAYPNEPAFVVPDTLRRLVKQGKLGRKTGEGYWKWEGDKRTNTPAL